MKFQVSKGTATFAALSAVMDKIAACNKQARELSEAHGADAYASGSRYVGGGIAALCYKQKPEGFKLLQYPNYYYPKALKANRPLLDALAALPKVENAELNEVVGFKNQTVCKDGGMFFCTHYGVKVYPEHFLLAMTEGVEFEAGPDLVELLESQYLALQGK